MPPSARRPACRPARARWRRRSISALASPCASAQACRHSLVPPSSPAMTEFVPPYPERPDKPLSPLAILRTARRNLIAVFEDKCFEYQFFSSRVLTRRMFVCNSPDTVAQALITRHDSFERKTPQVRNALTPLIGSDASFIADG